MQVVNNQWVKLNKDEAIRLCSANELKLDDLDTSSLLLKSGAKLHRDRSKRPQFHIFGYSRDDVFEALYTIAK